MTVAAAMQVPECDNGVKRKGGWEPANVEAAAAALGQSASATSSSGGRKGFKGRESHDLKITGSFGDVYEATAYTITGEWVKHPSHGWQIK
jgi:hypothetical protein